MSNDLSTLSGALLEMKDELIYELAQKGVTATYDSTTGLLGLIGEISNIQQGGGSCYKVTFNNASYTTSGGSATVSVTVLKNYNLCVGETVTFTSSTSTSTTATTDSNGVATATINFSGDTTLTASIGGASDTATITIQSYIYYSALTSDDGNWTKSNSSGITATYSDNGLTVEGTTTADRYYSLNMSSLSIPSTDIRVECDITGYVIGAYNNSTELVVCNSKLVFDSNNGQKLVLKAMTNNNVNVATMDIPSTPIAVKVEVGTSTINVYINNTLFGSVSTNNSYKSIALKTYNQRSMTIKNLSIVSL